MSSLAVGTPDTGFGVSAQFSTLVDLLEWRARRQADRVAYTFLANNGSDRISLNWQKLHRKAQFIGKELTAMNAAGKTVSLLYPSNLEYVAGFFGCLYAGAPALLNFPTDRPRPAEQKFQGECQTLVLNRALAESLKISEPPAGRDAVHDAARSVQDTAVSVFGPVDIDLDNTACVTYTSGSTGRPKGVAVSHGALLNLVAWHNSVFNISASDRATLLAGVSFDASVWELWPYMSRGASLDLPPDELRSSPEGLRDWITQRAVTVSFVPTPVAEPMLALEWASVVVSMSGLVGREGGAPGTARQRSASPSAMSVFTSWTSAANPCRSASSESFGSVAIVWREAISTGPSSPGD